MWQSGNKDRLARGEEEGGRRSGLVSSETWHIANEDSLARGEKEGGGRSGLVSLEMWHVTNEDSLTGGRKEEGGGQRVRQCRPLHTNPEPLPAAQQAAHSP